LPEEMVFFRRKWFRTGVPKRAHLQIDAFSRHLDAHDLRRRFGTRWARRVMPATLQLMMRHKSIETTMKYYVGQDADDVADELWAGYEKART
jgi:integrase